ncbi:MAG: hypothetical protein WAT23_07775 [Chromatiaceae bacterium]
MNPGMLTLKTILQPRESDGYTTFCSLNGNGSRVAVGWDTGHRRGVSTFVLKNNVFWEEVQNLSLTTELDGELNAVAMSGNGKRLAAGDCYNSLPSGCVKIFEFNADDADITKTATLTPTGGAADAYFGRSCCFNPAGTRLYVGATGHNNDTGAVFIFDLVGTTWTQAAIITLPGTDGLGSAVAVNQDETLLAIGAAETDYYAGRVYLLAKEAGGIFVLRDTIDPLPDWQGQFGSGVALAPSGNRLYVGAPTAGPFVQRQGAILTWDYADGAWSQQAVTLKSEPWAWQNLGLNLALSGDGMALVSGLQANAMFYKAWQYRVTGTVTDDNGLPAMRAVRVHHQGTGELVDFGYSLGGVFSLATFNNEAHYITCQDAAGGVNFNTLIYDGVIPQ